MASEWHRYTLSQIGKVVTGKTPLTSNKDFYGGTVPFITPSDMDTRKTIHSTLRTLTAAGRDSVRGSVLPSNSILVSCIGSDMGKVAINGREAVTNQQINSIAVSREFSYDFVYYSPLGRKDEFQTLARGGSAQPILNKGTFEKQTLYAPCLSEQRSIALHLSLIDRRIEELRGTSDSLETIARAIFKSWFVDFDPVRAKAEGREPEGMDAATAALFPRELIESSAGTRPAGWRAGAIRELGAVICGKTPPTAIRAYYGNDIPFITIPDMDGMVFAGRTARKLSVEGAEFQRSKYLPPHSICVSCIATVGLVSMTTEQSQTNQQINSVIPCSDFPVFFSYYSLKNLASAILRAGSGGSVFGNLNKSRFEVLPLLLPTPNIAQVYSVAVAPLFEKLLLNLKMSEALSELRDTLLPRLISGKLRVPEAEKMVEAVL